MGRNAYFENRQFIDAALEIIGRGGPGAVTVASIAGHIDAPVGSVYHRFSSREMILAELWLGIAESFQEGFLEILAAGEAVQASLYTLHWVREHPIEARVLLLYRREELVAREWPAGVRGRAAALERNLAEGLKSFVRRAFGRYSSGGMDRALFALIQVPLAAVRGCLEKGVAPPESADRLIRETCEHIMRRKP
ncbi:MAG: TetR/AcrR family transcriptional regulator [Spirochaetes bacterium]|nr:TetR/AcrR family transcriptional regulator [Spirochaetota bacterium]